MRAESQGNEELGHTAAIGDGLVLPLKVGQLSLGRFLTQRCIVTEVSNTVKGCKYLWGFGLICFGLTLPELRKAIWRLSGSFSRRDLSG